MTTHVMGAVRRAAAPGLGRTLRAALARLQEARMQAVLRRMSDADLERIGLARRDIPEHARRLVEAG